jgi:hypothetical protein
MVGVELRARVSGGYVAVVLRGELDTVDAESTGSAVAELAEGGQHLIIDLRPGIHRLPCPARPAARGRRPEGRR